MNLPTYVVFSIKYVLNRVYCSWKLFKSIISAAVLRSIDLCDVSTQVSPTHIIVTQEVIHRFSSATRWSYV